MKLTTKRKNLRKKIKRNKSNKIKASGKHIKKEKNMFITDAIFYEEKSYEYELGKRLLDNYKNQNVPMIVIENHNNIEQMRKKQNKEFPYMKRNLVIATRKTHKYVENHKVSDYLVPYTSSGCIAMCMYCYLVCNYNKCAYLRIFVNREYMLDRIKKFSDKADRNLVFEIGSNSDLILENTITGNLEWTIENFKEQEKGMLTFPTKFDMVDPILSLNHNRKIIVRMSVNPEDIINKIEFGTSRLSGRIEAINKLVEAGYIVGILIAPIILVDNWKVLYEELLKELNIPYDFYDELRGNSWHVYNVTQPFRDISIDCNNHMEKFIRRNLK